MNGKCQPHVWEIHGSDWCQPCATQKDFQPQLSRVLASHGTVAGARMAPTFAPELKRLVASARSFFGNHCAVALIAAGKFPPSPSPSAMRATKNPLIEETSA